MSSGLLLAAAAALFLALIAGAAIRRRRRRAALLDAALDLALRRQGGDALAIDDEWVALAGGAYRLPRSRLLAVCRQLSEVEAVAAAALTLLRQPLRPLAGPLSLKIHGPRIQLHLVTPGLLDLLPDSPRLARRPLADLGLTATYRVEGSPLQCVSDDHLEAQGIDSRDLHGIALAVLRQAFDESLVADLLAGATRTLESSDGSAAATLLVLPDFLPSELRIVATLDGPDHLTLGPEADPGPAGAGHRQFVIAADGCRIR